mgnify:CR=1 FL=1
MQHKISQLCDKVSVMYEKSMNLRRLKYDKPKESRTSEDNANIDFLVADIQALAREISYDKGPYRKVEE